MRIGEDVSIQTCRDEGYMVMDYPVHKFKRDPTFVDCRFTKSLPDYVREGEVGQPMMVIDVWLNYEDLWEMYLEHKASIDSMIGGSHPKKDEPDPYDLLSLASDIDSYCGLE